MTKAVKYHTDFYDQGAPKYEAGKAYKETEETLRHVACGHAESVDIKDSGIADMSGEPVVESKSAAEKPAAKEKSAGKDK